VTSTSFADEVSDYQQHGYVVVRELLDPSFVADLRRSAAQVFREAAPSDDSYGRVLKQVHGAGSADPCIDILVRDRWLASLASALSGIVQSEIRVFLDQALAKPPGGAPTIAHQDAPFLSFDDARSVNCWIALDPTTELNGALSYYPASHRLSFLERVHLDESSGLDDRVDAVRQIEPEVCLLAAGDAVFHNCLTVHAATANTTDRPRAAISIQYMSARAVYNGYQHDFLAPYGLRVGDSLDLDCFAQPDLDNDKVRNRRWR